MSRYSQARVAVRRGRRKGIILDQKRLFKREKLSSAHEPTCWLGREIFEAERQIARGEVIWWDEVKRKRDL